MSTKDSAANSSIATGARAPSIDLEDVRPLALPGGTVIFAQSHREAPHGTQIQSGEVPVCVAGVYSPTDLRRSLASLGFDSEALGGETATRAVRVAEREAGNAVVLA